MSNTTNNNKKSGAKKIISWIVAIAIIAAVIFLAAFNQALDTGWLDRSMKAMETENYTVSVAGMEYFYRTVANGYVSMLQSYGMSSYINIDSSVSHKLQECSFASDGSTWFDFFLSMTESEVSKILSCAEAAKAEGITLDDEAYADIDAEIENIKGTAESYGYSLKDYIKAVYGSAVTEDVIKDCLELQHIYNKYIETHVDAADTSDATLESLYNESKDEYDVVNYLKFTFDYNDLYLDEEEQAKAEADAKTADTSTETDTADTTATEAETEEPREAYSTTDRDEAVNKSSADANELKNSLNAAASLEEKEKVFEDFIKDYLTDELGLTDEEYESNKDQFSFSSTASKDDEILTWAFDENRAAGDVNMFTEKEDADDDADESKLADIYTVVLITKTAGRDETLATADIRHILFSNEDYEDDTKANEVYEELKAVLGTDEFTAKFEELAKEYSADTSNKDNGGLMEGLAKGATVTEFDNWVFGGENSEGSLGIVETEDYGWHIVYFEKEGLPTWKNTIINEIKANTQTEAENNAADTYTVTQDDNKMSKWIDA